MSENSDKSLSIAEEYLVIVNPNAGNRRGEKDWDKIYNALIKSGIKFKHIFTKAPGDAINIVKTQIENGYRNLIAVGGDGTMNEVVNGIFNQTRFKTRDITVGMITVGTGNDWGRMFGIPRGYKEAIETIKSNNAFVQDAGVVTYYNGTEKKSRYFVNIAGIGFDAMVVSRTNKMKEMGKGGGFAYLKSLIFSLLKYKDSRIKIVIDNLELNNDIFNISIGICKYNGGGMIQLPDAVADDGFFDVTVIKKIKKHDIVMNIRKLYNGTITSHPKIEGYKGKSVTIESDPLIHLETDGESLGHSPFNFEIVPLSVKVITGNSFRS